MLTRELPILCSRAKIINKVIQLHQFRLCENVFITFQSFHNIHLSPNVTKKMNDTNNTNKFESQLQEKEYEVRKSTSTILLLGITTLHNGMILSTLSIGSHGFALDFPKRPHTNEDVFLTYKPMIIS